MEAYTLVERVGRGAEGTVWLVKHRQLPRRRFVMKKIWIGAKKRSSLQEAEILKKLDHRHVIKYYDSFLDKAGEHLCIITDYCAGGNLDQKITRTREAGQHFSEPEIMEWFGQIVLALRYIHSKRILHRDLKTANIFLTEHNLIKVGDFGIAAQLEHSFDVKHTCVGSPYYMSPEVCQDIPYNTKSDIWALGCVLYEMCELTQAFKGSNLLALVTKICDCKYDPVSDRYSQELRALVAFMLNPKPEERPSTIALMVHPYVKECFALMVAKDWRASSSPQELHNSGGGDTATHTHTIEADMSSVQAGGLEHDADTFDETQTALAATLRADSDSDDGGGGGNSRTVTKTQRERDVNAGGGGDDDADGSNGGDVGDATVIARPALLSERSAARQRRLIVIGSRAKGTARPDRVSSPRLRSARARKPILPSRHSQHPSVMPPAPQTPPRHQRHHQQQQQQQQQQQMRRSISQPDQIILSPAGSPARSHHHSYSHHQQQQQPRFSRSSSTHGSNSHMSASMGAAKLPPIRHDSVSKSTDVAAITRTSADGRGRTLSDGDTPSLRRPLSFTHRSHQHNQQQQQSVQQAQQHQSHHHLPPQQQRQASTELQPLDETARERSYSLPRTSRPSSHHHTRARAAKQSSGGGDGGGDAAAATESAHVRDSGGADGSGEQQQIQQEQQRRQQGGQKSERDDKGSNQDKKKKQQPQSSSSVRAKGKKTARGAKSTRKGKGAHAGAAAPRKRAKKKGRNGKLTAASNSLATTTTTTTSSKGPKAASTLAATEKRRPRVRARTGPRRVYKRCTAPTPHRASRDGEGEGLRLREAAAQHTALARDDDASGDDDDGDGGGNNDGLDATVGTAAGEGAKAKRGSEIDDDERQQLETMYLEEGFDVASSDDDDGDGDDGDDDDEGDGDDTVEEDEGEGENDDELTWNDVGGGQQSPLPHVNVRRDGVGVVSPRDRQDSSKNTSHLSSDIDADSLDGRHDDTLRGIMHFADWHDDDDEEEDDGGGDDDDDAWGDDGRFHDDRDEEAQSLASTFAKEEDLLHFEDSRHRPHHHRDDEEEEEEEEYDLIEAMSLARIALESRGETQTQERPEKLTVLRFWLEAFAEDYEDEEILEDERIAAPWKSVLIRDCTAVLGQDVFNSVLTYYQELRSTHPWCVLFERPSSASELTTAPELDEEGRALLLSAEPVRSLIGGDDDPHRIAACLSIRELIVFDSSLATPAQGSRIASAIS
ncbi:NEK protein kinase [Salpingoeca rosetta]|uniref:non-specific serine/threonine protein kinase n=1 Tax=Salpingoeca rosetta (strain ATCC 50818 / BSB-021) TaxID=946362 RepID=F2U5E1_SALR5|nr:NEK protein kinase [Salpingoeca rosetta]EGD83157.1 NEK protein kinase [Salpingoeca rosetta]|eukprot:XP_004995521.1 NEK protein kinase [Salpingoeca rosetta]